MRIFWRGKNWILITPFKPAPEPKGLAAIKSEVGQRWPMTGLLDVLKEAALDTGFLVAFESSVSRVALPKAVLDQRLLLCLYGLGTNAGLKRVAGATTDASYEELLHVHRRFIHGGALRETCSRVAHATLAIRNATVWGRAGPQGRWSMGLLRPMPNRVSIPVFSQRLCKKRNAVERFFSKLKHIHAVATRYDKRDDSILALIQLASIRIRLRSYESVT